MRIPLKTSVDEPAPRIPGPATAHWPHDVRFVPAGTPHRFAGYGSDFRAWVVFYGPERGEAGPHRPR